MGKVIRESSSKTLFAKKLWFAAVAAVLAFFLIFYTHTSSFGKTSSFAPAAGVVSTPTNSWISGISENADYGLKDLCQQTNWIEGLWLHCHSYCGDNHTSICGGLNNARNRIQTCVRLAIDAGASIIIPSAMTRSETELVNTNAVTVCPDYFWDMKYLQNEMTRQCPQMKVRVCDDRSGLATVVETPKRGYLNPGHTNGTFVKFVEEVLHASNIDLANISAHNPVVVNYGDSYIGWNYMLADELVTIRKALFKVLRFNEKLLDLGSKVLQSPMLQGGKFIGVHLRGEKDWPAGFGSLGDQTRLYIEQIEALQTTVKDGIKTIYVSCGDLGAIETFRQHLQPLGYTVLDKTVILASDPALLHELEALSFDQKAIVEYRALVEAKFWMGLVMSSMSALIAYARTVDDQEDFFTDHVFRGSVKAGLHRNYKVVPALKGNAFTKLMVVNGVDIMESFP